MRGSKMSLRVLLTDADTILLSLYRAFLVDQRIEVRTASTALECGEALRQWRPDVLVLDADLPWSFGPAGVLARMREDPTVPVVPVLLVAAATVVDEAVPIRDYALLIKPVPPTVLADVIRTLADSGWGNRAGRRRSAIRPNGPASRRNHSASPLPEA